jgi:vacuolar-type H+-ATPase subunit D/Vma8
VAEQIFPTKGNLIACKKNMELAKLGFDLLDRKRNVLMREMMKLIDVAAGMQKEIGDTFQRAYRALQNANITLGIDQSLDSVVPEERGFSMHGHSIMGVDLPTGEVHTAQPFPYYGFRNSNSQLDAAYMAFDHVKRLCAKLAGIENMSAYIRKMALDGYCLNLDLPQLRRMAYLLQNCSNNLNQYAKRANECGKVYAADMEDLRQRLDELIDIGKQILSKLAEL